MSPSHQVTKSPELIVALDVDNLKKAKEIVDELYSVAKIFKIGPVLFTKEGPKIVKFIQKKKAGVFLDLKFLDIPNTVAQAVRQAARMKVTMLTLHVSGGRDMLLAAVEAAKKEAKILKTKKPLLIGVTVLTSQKANPALILKLAKTGLDCGLDGIVCSAREAAMLKKTIRKKFFIVTPGIRPDRISGDDQKRTATPKEAKKTGVNFIVVGRPILEAADPRKEAETIVRELS
jgi:orotidine-5'-phosphate decarboxylase